MKVCEALKHTAAVRPASAKCPLRVKSRYFVTSSRCPLYPQKRTLISVREYPLRARSRIARWLLRAGPDLLPAASALNPIAISLLRK
jgi:hypothetical protein